MGNRRRSRELAMQVLFQMEINKDDSMEAVELFCKHFKVSRKLRPFLLKLVQGVKQYQAEIDGLIDGFSDKWKISRMCGVDRNLLRLAVYELLYCDDIPAKVTINEAIEIAKRFGTENSGAFINGILDSIRISLKEEKARDENRVYE
ncbi:MAG: transcription antitermination factor NusB [Deltaproteobacteria bacterium]|nr:transcription antitermination factor NusB [Deltaproteobacteria bacterium]MCD6139001.1 transcription antitermination factor NusB [Deltaproteobacteria bacterium]RLB90843.1 MAG: transcription antitermination factor NusB [Deltaproteobacteria bacterium]RLB96450.1 MAG: transcription antitermination factor NusB [Deltaproteobacteria bacterium]RLC09253.1 MAG: transcription antitermination factor NusB [Deltaproteobacteria bacterium]